MLRNLFFAAVLALGMFASGTAEAGHVDFRSFHFSAANGATSFSAAGLTLHALPAPDAVLYQDSTDGVGVVFDYENDEIEGREILLIEFDEPTVVNQIFITDLFNENGYLERGSLKTDTGTALTFSADPGQTYPGSNGELTITLNEKVGAIAFFAEGAVAGPNGDEFHEFSVAGLTTPMPEPTSAVLFMIGGTLVAGAIRRREV